MVPRYGFGLQAGGWFFLLLGLVLGGLALFMETSVPASSSGLGGLADRVSNIGLMSQRDLVMQWATLSFVGGCVLLAGGVVAETVAQTSTAAMDAAARQAPLTPEQEAARGRRLRWTNGALILLVILLGLAAFELTRPAVTG